MFPKFLREIIGSLPHGRDFGFIPIANEEIATKHCEVLGQSAFALLNNRTLSETTTEKKTKWWTMHELEKKACANQKGPENHRGCQIQVSLSWLGVQSRKMAG
jgi:hypothetical protein